MLNSGIAVKQQYANILAVKVTTTPIFGPRQANLLLIAYASSEGSGETARIRAGSPEPSLLA